MRAITLLVTFIAASALAADTPTHHYKTELTEGTSGSLILENDSQNFIEAFTENGRCGRFFGQSVTLDVLQSSTNNLWGMRSKGGVAPWERATFGVPQFKAQPTDCNWTVTVEAVIYSDGSYEGDEGKVRILQAERDGIAAALRYWAQKISNPPDTPTALESLESEAEALSKTDREKGALYRICRESTVACGYWDGRDRVDSEVAFSIKQSKNRTDKWRYATPVWLVTEWQKVVDGNASLKKLDAVFPLPAEFVPHDGPNQKIE